MEAKDILMGLVWKYGWKYTEDALNELKIEYGKRSEELKELLVQPTSKVEEEPKVKVEDAPKNLIENQSEQANQPIEEKKKPVNKSKLKQREAEKKKREENEAKGIFAEDLLTPENLRNWRERGYSSAYISRELVGCREEEVSRLLRALASTE